MNFIYKIKKNTLLIISILDPDAPNHKDIPNEEWQHWLVVNIPGNNVSKGETLTEYVGPSKVSPTGKWTILKI